MHQLRFTLNNKPMSALVLGTRSFPAFSGLKPNVNQRMQICVPHAGPIPLGTYYVVDRESGGYLGWLYDAFGQRSDWFALYANDGKLDDETFCNEVKRGSFRLHPKVGAGISRGCITIDKQADFNTLKTLLRAVGKTRIPGKELGAYGTVSVQ